VIVIASSPAVAPTAKIRELGARAENLVATWLAAQGYAIVARNLRLGELEIDVVARRGPVIAVVEVRTRGAGAFTSSFGSIDAGKRMRIRRAGERLWQRRYRHDRSVERLRFDVASVNLAAKPPSIEYVIAAF
jgi:putative endonuclease